MYTDFLLFFPADSERSTDPRGNAGGALLRVLPLGRAELVEVVELAAGEHMVVGPLAIVFLVSSLDMRPSGRQSRVS